MPVNRTAQHSTISSAYQEIQWIIDELIYIFVLPAAHALKTAENLNKTINNRQNYEVPLQCQGHTTSCQEKIILIEPLCSHVSRLVLVGLYQYHQPRLVWFTVKLGLRPKLYKNSTFVNWNKTNTGVYATKIKLKLYTTPPHHTAWWLTNANKTHNFQLRYKWMIFEALPLTIWIINFQLVS